MISVSDARARWIAGIERNSPLSAEERQAVEQVPMSIRTFGPRADIVRYGDRPTQSCIVLEGFCWRYRVTGDGSRQIMALHLVGDMPDLQSLHLDRMDYNFGTVARSTIGFVTHRDIKELVRQIPHLCDVLWRATLIEAAIYREWMVGLGSRNAVQRTAHLFAELYYLSAARGLVTDGSYPLPLTQDDLADALGLSTIHVNRVMRELREASLLTMRAFTVNVLDLQGLMKTARFDPTYLNLAYSDRLTG